jgi:hypothetical protein
MKNYVSSLELYETIISDLSIDARLKNSLVRIKQTCDEIEKEAVELISKKGFINKNPIYIASVGKKCESLFNSPTAESINRNSKKEPLKPQYIKLRAIEFENKYKDQIGEIKQIIHDPYTLSLKNRNIFLEQQVRALSKLIKQSPARPVDDILKFFSHDSSEDLNEIKIDIAIQNKYREVISKLRNQEHLRKFGMKIDSEYIVDAISEDVFLTRDELNALSYFASQLDSN